MAFMEPGLCQNPQISLPWPQTSVEPFLPAAAASLCLLTFIAVSDCVKVDVILLVGEEQEAEPGVKGVDGDDEEDPDDVPLLVRRAVVAQVHVDLNREKMNEGSEEDSKGSCV